MGRTGRLLAVPALLGSLGAALVAAPAAAPAHAAEKPTVQVVAAEGSSITAEAQRIVAAMDVGARARSVVMGHIPTTDASALGDYMASGLGGFILMGSNVPASATDLRAVTAALVRDPAMPPLIAVDEEGGDVTRLPWDGLPAGSALAAGPSSAAEAAFAGRGALVAAGGASVNFGVVADVATGPASFIFSRALGTTSDDAAARVAAAVRGEAPFAMSTLKHFPGHGAAEGDSHRVIPATPMSMTEWRRTTAPPFAAGIDAGADLVMFGHLAYTAVDRVPASLSPVWHRILRDELGFDGVSVTDDLGMLVSSGDAAYADPVGNAVAAIAAGSDMVLMVVGSDASTAGRMAEGIAAAVKDGRIPGDRLTEATERVMALRLQIAAAAPTWRPCPECTPAG